MPHPTYSPTVAPVPHTCTELTPQAIYGNAFLENQQPPNLVFGWDDSNLQNTEDPALFRGGAWWYVHQYSHH